MLPFSLVVTVVIIVDKAPMLSLRRGAMSVEDEEIRFTGAHCKLHQLHGGV